MAEKFVGRWKLVDSKNFDDYLKAVGVGLVLRKTVGNLKPTQAISIEGDTITLKSISSFKTTEVNFRLGEAFNETTGDGRKMRTTYTMQGDDLMCVQEPVKDGEVGSTMLRTLTAEGMTMTLEAAGVQSIRKYVAE